MTLMTSALKILPWVIEGGKLFMSHVGDKKTNEIEKLNNEIRQKDEVIRIITQKAKIYFLLFIVSLGANIAFSIWMLRR